MAFKMTKADETRLQDVQRRLAAQRQNVEQVVASANEQIEQAKAKVADEINAYNEIVGEARGVIEDIRNEAQSEYDDKSEKWLEGERGQAVAEWLSGLETAENEFEDVPETEIAELDFDAPDHPDLLAQLEREPSS